MIGSYHHGDTSTGLWHLLSCILLHCVSWVTGMCGLLYSCTAVQLYSVLAFHDCIACTFAYHFGHGLSSKWHLCTPYFY